MGDGAVAIDVERRSPTRFALHLRIPGWLPPCSLAVTARASIQLRDRDWLLPTMIGMRPADAVRPRSRRWAVSASTPTRSAAGCGRVTLKRGTLVYASRDGQPDHAHRVRLPRQARVRGALRAGTAGRAVTLSVRRRRTPRGIWNGDLYRPSRPGRNPSASKGRAIFRLDNSRAGRATCWSGCAAADKAILSGLLHWAPGDWNEWPGRAFRPMTLKVAGSIAPHHSAAPLLYAGLRVVRMVRQDQ